MASVGSIPTRSANPDNRANKVHLSPQTCGKTTSSMKCETPYCRNEAAPGRRICYKCKTRKYRQSHPIKSAYQALKDNARRRGKAFDLSFEQFKAFVNRTDYMKGKGRHSDSFHVDRIDETKGYTIGNLQVLTNGENVRKYLQFSYNQQGKPDHFRTVLRKSRAEIEGVPF